MKIVLFRDGQPGVVVTLAGDEAQAELEELLGGEIELLPLRNPLALMVRADGEAERLPIRYGLHRLGREVEPIAGDCAIVAVNMADGGLRDIKVEHLPIAECYVRPMGSAERPGAGQQ